MEYTKRKPLSSSIYKIDILSNDSARVLVSRAFLVLERPLLDIKESLGYPRIGLRAWLPGIESSMAIAWKQVADNLARELYGK